MPLFPRDDQLLRSGLRQLTPFVIAAPGHPVNPFCQRTLEKVDLKKSLAPGLLFCSRGEHRRRIQC